MHELLGKHKPSSEWYTPLDIWDRIEATFNQPKDNIYDPCPVNGSGGLEASWVAKKIYVNSPSPAAPWALKAIQTHLEHPEVNIIFACFSEAVIWQVNDLLDYPTCWVRNRISWIDGNPEVKGQPNPNYLKPAKSPRNYNCFVCLSTDKYVISRFCENFEVLGTIRKTYECIF
jgi:hypothetical protein